MDEPMLSPIATVIVVIASAFFGSLCYALGPEPITWKRSATSVVVGFSCGSILVWAVCDWLALNSVEYKMFVAFWLGLTGNVICQGGVLVAKSKVVAVLTDAVRRAFNLPRGNGSSRDDTNDGQQPGPFRAPNRPSDPPVT